MDRQTGGWKNEQRDGQEDGHAKLNKLSSKTLKRPTLPRASQPSYKVLTPPCSRKNAHSGQCVLELDGFWNGPLTRGCKLGRPDNSVQESTVPAPSVLPESSRGRLRTRPQPVRPSPHSSEIDLESQKMSKKNRTETWHIH